MVKGRTPPQKGGEADDEKVDPVHSLPDSAAPALCGLRRKGKIKAPAL